MFASPLLRVRAILDGVGLTPFKKLLPKDVLAVPAVETQRYPSALLTALKSAVGAEQYSYLGIIAEELLRIPPGFIRPGAVVSTVKKAVPTIAEVELGKVRLSKTTQPFCDALNATARLLRDARTPGEPLLYDQVVSQGSPAVWVEGHPDIRNSTQVFEVKLTGRLKEGWTYFLCQVFAYAALDPAVTDVHLVLPLQQTVWKRSLADWDKRDAYLAQLQKSAAQLMTRVAGLPLADQLQAGAQKLSAPAPPPAAAPLADLSGIFMGLLAGGGGFIDLSGAGLAALLGAPAAPAAPAVEDRGAKIRRECLIGSHIQKLPSLKATFESAPNPAAPWQIFLGSTQSSKLNIKDADIAAGAAVLAKSKTRFFVHSPYIINLCHAPTAEDSAGDASWHQELLKKNLRYAAAAGCRGVVVHVGKATTIPLTQALANMRANILACLEAATPACPLLLETPAGQGTEVLTDADEFIHFVASFKDPRFRICLDTCHTFVCGQDPLSYIKKVQAADPALLTLIHYNDSAVPCGCRKDRHAFMGTGHIGMEKMEEIAHHCHAAGLPMVIE
jgi:deoxyribonuclease-4